MKLALIARTDLRMSREMIAAQVAHAAVLAVLTDGHRRDLRAWLAEGEPKVVLRASSAEELDRLAGAARSAGLPVQLVRGAGHTQVAAGTLTCLAVGPAEDALVDVVTGDLPLL